MSDAKKINPLFRKIATARGSAGGNRLRDGNFLLTLLAVVFKDASKDEAENDTLIFEFKVEESEEVAGGYYIGDSAAWETTAGAKLVGPNKVGDCPGVALVFSGDKKHKASMGNAISIIKALLGATDDEANANEGEDMAQTIDALRQKDNPARGRQVRALSYRKKIKGGDNVGKPCVNFRWETVEQSDDEIAALRAALDKSAKAAEEKPAT